MKIQLNKRNIFYILLAILLFLLAIRYSFQIEVPRIILTAVVLMIAMLGDQNEIIAISMACMPMHQAIDFYIAIVGCACILILKKLRSIKIGFPMVLIMFLLVWELLHCFESEWSPRMLLTSVIPLIFIGICISSDLQDTEYPFIVRTLALVSAYMGVLQLAFHIVHANGNLFQVFATLGRLGSMSEESTLIGGAINPNTMGIINVLGMTGLLQLRFAGSSKKSDNVLFFVLLLSGVLTQSKTFVVCLLAMFILLLVHQKNNLKKMFRILAGAIPGCALIILVMGLVFPNILEDFIERFTVEDITTGRIAIMSHYHKFVMENPDVMFFGIGLSDFTDKVMNVYNVSTHVPHNSIQEIVVAWGIPGILLIALLIFMIVHKSTEYSKKKTVLNYIPLIIILTKCMAGQFLTSGYTMIALVFSYLSLLQDFSDVNRIDEKSL